MRYGAFLTAIAVLFLVACRSTTPPPTPQGNQPPPVQYEQGPQAPNVGPRTFTPGVPVSPIQHNPFTITTNDPAVTVPVQQPVSITTTNVVALRATGLISQTNSINGPLNPASVADLLSLSLDPTGVVDSTAALNAALLQGNGTVSIPSGVYKISAPLQMGTKSLYLRGMGAGTTTLRWSGAAGTSVLQIGNGIDDVESWRVQDLTIDGGGVTPGLKVNYAHQGVVSHVTFTNCATYGVWFKESWVNTLEKSSFLAMATTNDAAIILDGGSGHRIAFNNVSGGATALTFAQESNGTVIGPGNVFEGNLVGIDVVRTTNPLRSLSIFGNFFEGNTITPMRFGTGSGVFPTGVNIIGNEIATHANGAIVVSNINTMLVQGNHFGVQVTYDSSVTNLWLGGGNVYGGKVMNAQFVTDMDYPYQLGIDDAKIVAFGPGTLQIQTNLNVLGLMSAQTADVVGYTTSYGLNATEISGWHQTNNIVFKDATGTVIATINVTNRNFGWDLGGMHVGGGFSASSVWPQNMSASTVTITDGITNLVSLANQPNSVLVNQGSVPYWFAGKTTNINVLCDGGVTNQFQFVSGVLSNIVAVP